MSLVFERAPERALIGVSADIGELKSSGASGYFLKRSYVDALSAVGAAPALIPFPLAPEQIERIVESIDGALISGGDFDIDPSHFNEERSELCSAPIPDRTEMELALFRAAFDRGLPILGICGGAQLINVALGGSLFQDITLAPRALKVEHSQSPKPPTQTSHTISPTSGSYLARLHPARADSAPIEVNSTHHQAIRDLGSGVIVCARAADGIIEAIESTDMSARWVLGLQWHPEALYRTDRLSRSIFESFVRAALERRAPLDTNATGEIDSGG